MSTLATHERMVEEQAWTAPPPDALQTSRIRWAMLHGQALTNQGVAEEYQVSTPTLSMIAADLERAGFVLERVRLEDRQLRIRVVNLDHTPVPFVSRGKARKATNRKAAKRKGAAPPRPTAIRAGRLRDVAAALTAAYPDAVALASHGNRKQVGQCIFILRSKYGWQVETAGDMHWRLIDTPDGVPGRSTAVGSPPSTAVEPHPDSATARTTKVRADREELEELRAFHRIAPVTPRLGQVFRTTMVAEDNSHAVLVLTDLTGARWYVRVEGSDAGVRP